MASLSSDTPLNGSTAERFPFPGAVGADGKHQTRYLVVYALTLFLPSPLFLSLTTLKGRTEEEGAKGMVPGVSSPVFW